MWVYGLDWAGPGQRQLADACECGNEPSGSVKCGEFLDQLQTSQLLNKGASKDRTPIHQSSVRQPSNCISPLFPSFILSPCVIVITSYLSHASFVSPFCCGNPEFFNLKIFCEQYKIPEDRSSQRLNILGRRPISVDPRY